MSEGRTRVSLNERTRVFMSESRTRVSMSESLTAMVDVLGKVEQVFVFVDQRERVRTRTHRQELQWAGQVGVAE